MARYIYFILVNLLGLGVYFGPLKELTALSLHSELYSHFLLIPVVSIFFLLVNRKKIFTDNNYSPYIGMCVLAAGLVSYTIGIVWSNQLSQNDFLFFCMIGTVTWLIGSFTIFFGKRAFQQAMFPLIFLVFMIPIPNIVLNPLIRILQVGSGYAVYGIFKIIGIPFYRDGMTFEFTGLAIEVAKQCSGIRSTLALLITSVMAGHLFLQTSCSKFLLVLSIFPITIIKNAVRITTITLLAIFVDKAFLTNSWLHHSGGIVFFMLGLLLLAPALWLLRRLGKMRASKEKDITAVASIKV